jgi:hypothetical protein
MNPTVRWIALALLGIAIAAGVSIAASRLASQQIGLSSQPISAGDALVPHAPPRRSNHGKHPQKTPTTRTTTAPTTTVPTLPVPAPTTTAPTTPTGPSRSGGEGDGGGGADD